MRKGNIRDRKELVKMSGVANSTISKLIHSTHPYFNAETWRQQNPIVQLAKTFLLVKGITSPEELYELLGGFTHNEKHIEEMLNTLKVILKDDIPDLMGHLGCDSLERKTFNVPSEDVYALNAAYQDLCKQLGKNNEALQEIKSFLDKLF